MFRWAAVCVALGLAATPALADTLTFEPTHTSVVFQYAHFGLSHPSGKIMGATGTLILDDKNLSRKAFGLGHYEPIVGDDIDLIIDAEVY